MIRLSTTLDLLACLNGNASEKIFGGNSLLSELLDTLEHGVSGTYRLAAEEAVTLDQGDIGDIRFIYLEGDAEFSVAFAAGQPASAYLDGVGGTYPTAFAGGENLDLVINGIAVNVVFDAADQTRDQVVARINFVAALADASFVADPIAFPLGTQLRLESPTAGLASTVEVLASSSAAALTALGLAAASAQGDSVEPGTTDVQVARPVDPSGASAAYGVKAYLLGTVQATAITVTNVQDDAELNLKAFIAGDLVSLP